jgi:hypothetical protein
VTFDRLELLDGTTLAINGRPLIERVREVEAPLTRAEVARRAAAGEPRTDERFRPGDYMYLPRLYRLPSRHLLGEPRPTGFVLAPDDPQRGKTRVLGCTCGVADCWFITVRICLDERTVTWSDFTQFHRRSWVYPLGPYVFERAAYEAALAG